MNLSCEEAEEEDFEFVVLQTVYKLKVESILPTSFRLIVFLFESSIRGENFHTFFSFFYVLM